MKHVFGGGRFTSTKIPTININPKGIIHLNNIAMSQFKAVNPFRVEAIFDDDKSELILKRNEEGPLKIDLLNNGKTGKIYSKTFIEWLKNFDIDLKKYTAKWDEKEQALIIKVDKILKVKSSEIKEAIS